MGNLLLLSVCGCRAAVGSVSDLAMAGEAGLTCRRGVWGRHREEEEGAG